MNVELEVRVEMQVNQGHRVSLVKEDQQDLQDK